MSKWARFLPSLTLRDLLKEDARLGAVGVAQHRVTLVAVVQLVAQRGQPEVHQGVQVVPVQGKLPDVVAGRSLLTISPRLIQWPGGH